MSFVLVIALYFFGVQMLALLMMLWHFQLNQSQFQQTQNLYKRRWYR